MLSLSEAVEQGIAKLRRDPWEPNSHVEIHITEAGLHGPWVKVRSGVGLPGDMEGVVDGRFEETVFYSYFDWDEPHWEPWIDADGGEMADE